MTSSDNENSQEMAAAAPRPSFIRRFAKRTGDYAAFGVGWALVVFTAEIESDLSPIALAFVLAGVFILIAGTVGAALDTLLHKRNGRLDDLWKSMVAAGAGGLPAGYLLAEFTTDMFVKFPGGLSTNARLSGFDGFALIVGAFILFVGVLATIASLSRKPLKDMPPLSRSDRKLYLITGPSCVAESGAVFALVFGRALELETMGALIACACVVVAVGTLILGWRVMDELSRAYSFEVFGWSFLILFFAAPLWAAGVMTGLAPPIGAYESFVLMNVVYLVVACALYSKHFGQSVFAVGLEDDDV